MELKNKVLVLDERVTQAAMEQINKVYHTNILDMLLSALALTIRDWTKEDTTLITLFSHSREQQISTMDMSRTVGCFSTQFPVRLKAYDDLGATIKHTKDMMRRIPDQGRFYEMVKTMSAENMYQVEPEISFNYLGRPDWNTTDHVMDVTSPSILLQAPEHEVTTHLLHMEAILTKDQLSISVFYQEADLQQGTIEKLLATYQEHWLRLMDHCTTKNEAELTVTDITLEDISMEQLSAYKDELPNIKHIYPLAPMQEGMLYHALTDELDTYIKLSCFQVEGHIDLEALNQALNIVVERHDILRTIFDYTSFKQNMQVVYRSRNTAVTYIDLSDQTIDHNAHLEDLLKQYRQRSFDLNKDELLRIVLVRMNENTYSLIFHLHHILMDGWCNSLILIELFKIYNELKHGIQASLNEVVPYVTYIDWLKNKDIDEAKAYWQHYLHGCKEVTQIPFEKEHRSNEFVNKEMVLVIDEEKTASLIRMAQESKVTVNTIIQSIWAILLHKYNNRDDIVYGYVVSGRNAEIEGVEVIPGLFINTIPLRVMFQEHTLYPDLIQHISSLTLQNNKYDYVSLAEIQNLSELKNDLISSLLIFENYPIDEKQLNEEILKNNDLKILNSVFVLPQQLIEGTNYNLTLVVTQDDSIAVNFIYNGHAYSEAGISKIMGGFGAIVDQIIENRHISTVDIDIVDDEDKHQILYTFNCTQSEYPKDKTIVQLFEEQVDRAPHHTALIYQDVYMTYEELNMRANRLAHHLRQKGVGSDTCVGILGDRSALTVIGILGILKAGGAYLPIDPKYPAERINRLLEDSKAEVLLTSSTHREALQHHIDRQIDIVLMDLAAEELASESAENPMWRNSSSDLAYVMYTSGSTGKPKGVMIEHQSVVRLVKNTNYVTFSEGDRILQTGAIVFDASTFELWGALLNGISLVLVDEHTLLHAERLGQEIKQHHITTMWLTAPLFNQLVQQDVMIFEGLHTLIVGGDALSWEHTNQARRAHPNLKLINGYGPTENTTFSTYYVIEKVFNSAIPIGQAISNSNVYIVDRHNHLQPIGVAGELCVGGDGLARGYLNNEELTAATFVPNPFVPGTRMYKTGDLARWLPDGNIEYLGRIDEQVKIRGFRIEPNEIALQLMLHEEIQDAVVLARTEDDGQAYLCAYVVSKTEQSASALREYMAASLPSYMIPAYFVQLERLPLTPNGKIDRKALPVPDGDRHTGIEFVAPRNEMERSIAEVWANILGVKQVGIHDDFFILGGDSIKAIQAIAQMNKKGYSFDIKHLLNSPRIKDLIVHVKQKQTKLTIDQREISGELELTPIQLWFLEQEHLCTDHFNQSLMLFSKHGFREDKIGRAFDQIVQHHDVLRAVFVDEKWINKQVSNKLYDFRIYDFRGEEVTNEYITNLCTELQASMKLTKGPLVKLGLFKTDKGDHLLVTIHQMVVDTVSWRIIMADFERLYEGKEQSLPLKTTSFQEWASKLTHYASKVELKNELNYWNRFSQLDIKELNKDYHSPNVLGAKVIKKSIVLDKLYTDSLLTKVNTAYSTELHEILLSALTCTLANFNQAERIQVQLESNGREPLLDDVDISRTVGWFTSQYPVALHSKASVSDLIISTKDTLRRVPRNGIGYGMLKYVSPFELKSIRKPDVCFKYVGQLDELISGEWFSLSDISPGEEVSQDSVRLYPLNIIASVLQQQFTLTISYIREEYQDETIDGLLQRYIDNLKQIIDHCLSKDHVVITASDITDEDITWDELDPYLKQLDTIKRIYPLTPMQEGLLYHSLADKGEFYHLNMELRVIGDLNEELFRQSFKDLIDRYDVFRTTFDSQHFKENMQIVYKSIEEDFTYLDIRDLQVDQEAYITKLVSADRKRGFDLSCDNLIRLYVVRMKDQQYSLILSNHHIILDGWSFGIISSELFDNYRRRLRNAPVKASYVTPYETYIKWIGSQDHAAALHYWSTYLKGYDTTIDIPFKKAATTEGRPQEVILELDKEIVKQIELLAKNNNVTINTVFQSIWAIQLQKYNHVDDVVFGFIVSGRTTQINGIDEMVGLFINTIPLRVNTIHEKRYSHMLQQIKSDFNASEPYQYCSIADIQKLTEVGNSLINGLMVFENYPIDKDMINQGLQEQVNLQIQSARSFEETNYSFNVKIFPGEAFVVKFDYNDGIYDEQEVNHIKSHFSNILHQVITNPNIRIDEIEMVGHEEKVEPLFPVNDTDMEEHPEETIQQLFEYQVTRNKDKSAVICGDAAISYDELNKRANALARHLQHKGIGTASIVPILMDRSIDMIVGVLAILKAGAAYLPIDTSYPEDRINYILEDSKAEILLSTSNLTQSRVFDIKEVIDLDQGEHYALSNEPIENRNVAHDLAYVIYTSGTTGKPKGVMVEHKGVINLRYWFEHDLGIGKDEHILQFASIAFDAFSWELYMALLLGNTLFIPDKEVLLSADLLNEYISRHEITTLTLPPFVAANVEAGNGLKRVITAGSELKYEQVSHLLGKVEVINAYGPTEDTVCTTTCKLSSDATAKITIGTPIRHHQVWILDTHNKRVPTGVTGELCIAGVGLARGYLHNDQLTREKFIDHPYQQGERLYKTGDMARRLPDGTIEFMGRIDHQVKIRGYRIEIGEIEQNLLQMPEVSQVAVVDKEMDGVKCLCAYYVSDMEIAIHVMRESLGKKLPAYMIPAYFVRLESLPFNANGKVDRKQLPELNGIIQTGTHYEDADNEVERLMLEVCKDVLGLEQLGVRDSLFEVGGDSIRIAKIHKQLKKAKIEISIKDMFYYENVRDMYKHWAHQGVEVSDASEMSTEPVITNLLQWEQSLTEQLQAFNDKITNEHKRVQTYPLSAMQEILLDTNRTYSGAILDFNEKINVPLLKKSIKALINEQGLLRSTLLRLDQQTMIQQYDIVEGIDIPYLDLEHASEEQKEAVQAYIHKLYGEQADQTPIADKLLYKVIILKYTANDCKVYMPFNHLIFDAMSYEIIEASIRQAYSNNGQLERHNVLQYEHYITEQMKGPQNVTEKELIEKYNLHDFHTSYRQYFEKYKETSFVNTIISIPMTDRLRESVEEMSWDISLHLFLKVLELNFELDTVPFAIMHTGRKYESNNYYLTIGAFIDILPLSVRCNQHLPLEQINESIRFAYEKNINFAALMSREEPKNKYKKVRRILKEMHSPEAIQIPIFNYLGMYDAQAEMQDELSRLKEVYASPSTTVSTEVAIAIKEQEVMIRLFCEEHNIAKMTEELHAWMRNFNQLLFI
ncbi:non-ribosomal peptide synthetase [Paenibacillus taiwanensis]|uniref:non-ribosomal peptide synthetase n=1 Tax=Paenibacillus taiwanensis TaxID=401638 RepID=UPI00041F7279|nr:non-ribosomal peptide synthetase [Paenibacillus taiwanensis]